MKRLCGKQKLIKKVAMLVRCHMHPLAFIKNNASMKAYKRLAKKLSPDLSLRQLGFVALCDWRGRNAHGDKPLTTDDEKYTTFVAHAQKANVLHAAEPPVLLGRHLLDDVEPGKEMGELLAKAYQMQIDEGITDIDLLRQRILKK